MTTTWDYLWHFSDPYHYDFGLKLRGFGQSIALKERTNFNYLFWELWKGIEFLYGLIKQVIVFKISLSKIL